MVQNGGGGHDFERRSRERVTASSRNAKKARESIYGVVTVCWRVSRRNTRRQWGTGTAAGGYLTGPCKQRRANVKGKRQRCRAEAAVVEGGREAGKLNALTWTNTFKNAATKKNKNAAPRTLNGLRGRGGAETWESKPRKPFLHGAPVQHLLGFGGVDGDGD